MTDPTHDSEDRGRVHDYAGGEIQSHAGGVNRWLLAVYLVLALWGVYYLITYWGGLGPGLEIPR
jgi:hypothetical protein